MTFSQAFRSAVGSIWLPVELVLVALLSGVKQLGCDVDLSPPSSVEVKNEWGCIPLLLNVSLWHAEGQVYCPCRKILTAIGMPHEPVA